LPTSHSVLMRSFFCFNHQGKADMYVDALKKRSWREVRDPGQALFILSDIDFHARSKTLQSYRAQGIRVFLYSHAARPNIFWDFPDVDFCSSVDAYFLTSEGHIDILKAIGVPYPMHVVGWHLCPIKPFRPRDQVKRILFAPIHPNSNGFLSRMDRELNAQTFRKLLSILTGDVALTVRHIRDLKLNGLWRTGGVEYIEGQLDLSYSQIDAADLVVSHQTFASLAVARGVPTLMMGEWHAPRWGGTEEKLSFAKSWDTYKHLLMYPLDILAEEDIAALFLRATHSDGEIADWRSRMIGEPFDANCFVDRLEAYLS
jgi:hypothetical protein